jgi:CDP-diglyceride synthetase
LPAPPHDNESGTDQRSVWSGLLATLSLVAAAVGTGLLGVLAAPAILVTFGGLLAYVLGRVAEGAPPFPKARPSLTWLGELVRFIGNFVVWALPQVPFAAPFITFVAVTWPLAPESASLQFQQQASEIIPVLLIGFVIETGAIRWRNRPVNWILGLMTVLILVAGETFALVSLATNDPNHADIVAGSMAAGVVAILIAAIQGSSSRVEMAERARQDSNL